MRHKQESFLKNVFPCFLTLFVLFGQTERQADKLKGSVEFAYYKLKEKDIQSSMDNGQKNRYTDKDWTDQIIIKLQKR